MDEAEAIKKEYSEIPPNIYGFGHTKLYRDVLDAIKNDREPLVNAEAGKKALELVLAIYQSAATGKSVRFPLTEGSTLDFKGRFENV